MNFNVIRLLLAGLGAAVMLATPVTASADVINCTTGCTQVFSGAAFFSTTAQSSTGTGVIDSFVRFNDSDNGAGEVEDGVNTSARPLLNGENNSPNFTRDLQLSEIPVLNISGVTYYEFLLDINQQGADPLLALNSIQLCTAASGGLNGTTTCPGALKYSFGATDSGSSYVLLDYNLNGGSGSGDLFMYIPTSVLGTNMSDYVYLYSQFGLAGAGVNAGNNDGFEEWAVRICGETYGKVNGPGGSPGTVLECATPQLPQVPEPGSMLLLGTGLLGLAAVARRRQTRNQ